MRIDTDAKVPLSVLTYTIALISRNGAGVSPQLTLEAIQYQQKVVALEQSYQSLNLLISRHAPGVQGPATYVNQSSIEEGSKGGFGLIEGPPQHALRTSTLG